MGERGGGEGGERGGGEGGGGGTNNTGQTSERARSILLFCSSTSGLNWSSFCLFSLAASFTRSVRWFLCAEP